MAFQPDIIITTRDGVSLVVEAKVNLPNLECSEEDLKQYMVSMQYVGVPGFLHHAITTVCSAGW